MAHHGSTVKCVRQNKGMPANDVDRFNVTSFYMCVEVYKKKYEPRATSLHFQQASTRTLVAMRRHLKLLVLHKLECTRLASTTP